MNLYLFHLWTEDGRSPDTEGCEFDSLDAAYLDAHRAVIEISAEMLAQRRDPGPCAFEICDESGETLMMLPFQEVLRPRAQAGRLPFWTLRQRIESNLQRSRALNSDLAHSIADVRKSMTALRETLDALGSATQAEFVAAERAVTADSGRAGLAHGRATT